jgi:OmcA/MtrC family decaheme c-type cytochrome
VLINGVSTVANIPVKTVYKTFPLTATTPAARRQIVDINKCKVCHNGTKVQRLSLHGANRNEELGACVVCHNPNQTDIPYRTSGAEVSIDFKRMVHSIHAGGFRKTPFSVVGFQGTVYDFSAVRFPAELRNCVNCHIDKNGKGTFELPISSVALGSTINTQSAPGTVNVDPSTHLKISPTAATCSGCHDSTEVRSHMIRTGGATFGSLQQNIAPEKCINCHGPGKEESVRRAHEIGGSGDR